MPLVCVDELVLAAFESLFRRSSSGIFACLFRKALLLRKQSLRAVTWFWAVQIDPFGFPEKVKAAARK
jgi:hypothetical protein